MSRVFQSIVYLGTAKPKNFDNSAHGVPEDNVVYMDCTFDANGASEGLKSSKHWIISVIGGQSQGGVEDTGMDFCRGGILRVEKHTFIPGRAKQDVTIKGGFNSAEFIECPGLRVIEAGNYSKYDAKAVYPNGRTVKASPFKCCRPPVRGGHVVVAPGQPKVKVRLFHSEPWTGDVINKPLVPWMPAHRLILALFFWVRAKFFQEVNAAPEAEFQLLPGEL